MDTSYTLFPGRVFSLNEINRLTKTGDWPVSAEIRKAENNVMNPINTIRICTDGFTFEPYV